MATDSFLAEKDIEEGKCLNEIFKTLSPKGKMQAQVYLSALRDKEEADKDNQQKK